MWTVKTVWMRAEEGCRRQQLLFQWQQLAVLVRLHCSVGLLSGKDYLGLCKSNNLIYWCVYSLVGFFLFRLQTLIPPQAQKPMWTFGLELTGALDGDFQLPSAGSFCVNLEVCSLLHPEALWLQTTTLGSAEAGVTRCGQTERVRRVRRRVTLWPRTSSEHISVGTRPMKCEVNDIKLKPSSTLQICWKAFSNVIFSFLLPCTPPVIHPSFPAEGILRPQGRKWAIILTQEVGHPSYRFIKTVKSGAESQRV